MIPLRHRNIWFTSDQHWHHDFIAKQRGFKSYYEHDEFCIENWNELIKPNDMVYVVGDWTLEHPKSISHIDDRLNGNRILVRGNHDGEVKDYNGSDFVSITERIDMKIANEWVTLSHYQFKRNIFLEIRNRILFNKQFPDRGIKNEGQFLIHGHSHSNIMVMDKQINVALDANDLYPVHIDTIRDIIGKRGCGRIYMGDTCEKNS